MRCTCLVKPSDKWCIHAVGPGKKIREKLTKTVLSPPTDLGHTESADRHGYVVTFH